MVKLFKALFFQLLFWMLLFAIARIVFLLYYHTHLAGIGFFEIAGAFWHSLRLDLATACYILVVPTMFTVLQSIFPLKVFLFLNRLVSFVFIAAYSLISTIEIGIYDEWKTKLHAKSLHYLRHPEEVYQSASTPVFLFLIFLLILQIAVGFYGYKRYFSFDLRRIRRNYLFSIALLLLLPGFLFIGMRGGIQEIPITQSRSYYSGHNILNLAATNSGFNFIHSLNEFLKDRNVNPYSFFEDDVAEQIVRDIHYTGTDTTVLLLKHPRPNIVMIILESWSADLIEALGGNQGITPEFDQLRKSGYLFTDIYSSGSRSEQGMAAIFNGFPAHPLSVVTYQPDKYHKLPGLNLKLKEEGYFSSFYFGGQLMYGNIKSLIYYNGFDRVFDINNLPDMPAGKLGIHDGPLLEKFRQDLGGNPEPFFSALFTVSTHSPFDMPMQIRDFWHEKYQNLYLNSAFYTDSCLGAFFRSAEKEPWFENTLFVILPDHSHDSYKKWPYHSPEYHRTFFLFAGEVLREEFRGKTNDKTGSQVDLAATLLSQTGVESAGFGWSINLMNPYAPGFAAVSFEEGIGWIRGEDYFFYEPRFDRFYCREVDVSHADSLWTEGKAYLQVLFQQYLDF